MRQNYDKSFLQSILDQYKNLGTIEHFFLCTSGYENSNYYIETEKGRYVIKIFEGMGIKDENILFELEVMDYSYQAGNKTPRLFKNKAGRLGVKINRKQAAVMEFVEGEIKSVLADELVAEVGVEAGKIDKSLKYFEDGSKTRQNYEWDIKNVLILEKSLSLLPEKYDREILKQVFNEFKNIKPEFDCLPSGLIHNDIVPWNWLVKNGKLSGIIYFSDLAFSPYIQNVAVSLHEMAFNCNWRPGQASIFIKNYGKINPLSQKELELLYILIKVRFLPFIIEFNRWDVEYAVDRQRVETINDNYKFLKRFIDFGQKEFNKLINV